jgi:hypothetical protein
MASTSLANFSAPVPASTGYPVPSMTAAAQPETPTRGAFGTEFFKIFAGPKKVTRGRRSF